MARERGLVVCSECKENVTNGSANIMVNSDVFTRLHRYSDLRVICKPCTMRIDKRSDGVRYHSIWELHSVRDMPMFYFGQLVNDFVHPSNHKWDIEAADSFVDVLIELLPPQVAKNLLQTYFASEEWDGEGIRSERFFERRKIGEIEGSRVQHHKDEFRMDVRSPNDDEVW